MKIRLKKNGIPIKAVIIPHGISAGARRVLERVSATRRRLEPDIEEARIKTLEFGLKNFRIKFGAISPINPIIPPAHTHTLMASDEKIRTRNRRSLMFTPRLCAEFSPPLSKSRGFEIKTNPRNEINAGSIRNLISSNPLPLKVPMSQL